MEDCYKILGVKPNSTASEIKKAYRKRAKELHPDLSVNLSEEEKRMRELEFGKLVRAYEILSDALQKSLFDSSYAAFFHTHNNANQAEKFNYRNWLLERGDEESLCKLIFWDLMHNREDEAVQYFKKLNTEKQNFSLARYFSREEFMDYGYILCEELVIRSEYYDAILLLEQIIRMEYSFNYFRLFFPEVMALASNVLKKHIALTISDELAIDVFERALELRFGKKHDAFFLARIAECYYRMGDFQTAELCALKAREFDSSVAIDYTSEVQK